MLDVQAQEAAMKNANFLYENAVDMLSRASIADTDAKEVVSSMISQLDTQMQELSKLFSQPLAAPPILRPSDFNFTATNSDQARNSRAVLAVLEQKPNVKSQKGWPKNL